MSEHNLYPSLTSVLTAVLFHGVEGAPAPPSDPVLWEQSLPSILKHKLAGLALDCASAHRVSLRPMVAQALSESLRLRTAQALAIEGNAVVALHELRKANILAVVTKGPGIARHYPRPAYRSFSDIDVLVHPDRFVAAMQILDELGYKPNPQRVQPRAYFSRRCREGVNLVRADGLAIDLHHHIPPWRWGRCLTVTAIDRFSERVPTAGGDLVVACPTHNLLIVALHVLRTTGLPGQELHVWRDLAQLAPTADHEMLLSQKWPGQELRWLLGVALRQLPTFAQPRSLLESLPQSDLPSFPERTRFRYLMRAAGGRAPHPQLAHALGLPAPQAVAFLAGYMFPSQDFLAARVGTSRSLWRWWLRAGLGVLRRHHRASSSRLHGDSQT